MEGCRHRSAEYVSTGFGGIEQPVRCGDPVAGGLDGYCKKHTPASALRIATLEATNAKLVEALQALADKLDQVSKDSAGVFLIAAMHHCPYEGATYEVELKAARATLNQPKEIK